MRFKNIFALIALFFLCSFAAASADVLNPPSQIGVAGGGFGNSVGQWANIPAIPAPRNIYSIATPTYTWTPATSISNAQFIYANTSNNQAWTTQLNTQAFNFSDQNCLTQRNGATTAFPQDNVIQDQVCGPQGVAFWTRFKVESSFIDIKKYGSGYGFSLWVDGVWVGRYDPFVCLIGACNTSSTEYFTPSATASSSVTLPVNGLQTSGGSITTPGTGYVNGSYTNVPLTGGAGSAAMANITVSGGAVTSVAIVDPGNNYAATNTLSASNTNLGGSGSGFVWTVSSVSSTSNTTGLYNQDSIYVLSGTGAGQCKFISSYTSGRVANIVGTFSPALDSTSTIQVVSDANCHYVNGLDGSLWVAGINWGTRGVHDIAIFGSDFYGVDIGPNDSIWASSPSTAMPFFHSGDSFVGGSGGPFYNNSWEKEELGTALGATVLDDGIGGSGFCAIGNNNAFSIMDRIAPPTEAWTWWIQGSTAGTYAVNVTYGGSTQTATINWNDPVTTLQTKIQALTNLPANSVVASGGINSSPTFLVIHNAPGATITVDTTNLTVVHFIPVTNFTGEMTPRIPADAVGNPLPMEALFQGSGNDQAGGYTAAQTGACATRVAQYVQSHYPTVIAFMSDVVKASGTTITSTDLTYTAALQSAAANFNKVNGNVPFVQTMDAGVGAHYWIDCASNIGSPTNGTNDILCSLQATGHPTGEGHKYLATRIGQRMKALQGSK